MKPLSFAAAATLAIAGSLYASAATPPVPNGSFLEPYSNLWTVTVTSEKTHAHVVLGTWSDRGRFVAYSGKTAFERVQVFRITRSGKSSTTVNVFDPATMKPLERTYRTSTGDLSTLEFEGNAVRVVDATGAHRDDPRRSRVRVAGSYYDFSGGMYGLLLAGYPLQPGYRATISTIAEGDQSIQKIPFTVVRRETVEAKPGTFVSAWRVEVHWHDRNPQTDGSLMTFWLSKNPPYVIKLVYQAQRQGQTYVYTMA